MGQTDLLLLGGPAHLRRQAVGDPEIRTHLAEELGHHLLAPRGADHEAGGVVVMEHPQPPALLADPDAGFVRLDGRSGQQTHLELIRLSLEGRLGGFQHVGERAFAN